MSVVKNSYMVKNSATNPKKEESFTMNEHVAMMKPEKMKYCKLSLNKVNELPCDISFNENIFTKNLRDIRCTVTSSKLHQSTDYFVFKTKTLILTINTKVLGKYEWTVSRQEQDFYILRNILSSTFGQCFIPPLLPLTKEQSFDNKSLRSRCKTFTRFLRSLLKSQYLCSHPMVLEFLKIDHHSID